VGEGDGGGGVDVLKEGGREGGLVVVEEENFVFETKHSGGLELSAGVGMGEGDGGGRCRCPVEKGRKEDGRKEGKEGK